MGWTDIISWDIKPRSSFSQSTFRKNLPPPSSVLKSKPRKNQHDPVSKPSLFFDPEDEGGTFLRNVDWLELHGFISQKTTHQNKWNFIHNWRIFKCHNSREERFKKLKICSLRARAHHAISENCSQPELNTCYWMEQPKLRTRQRSFLGVPSPLFLNFLKRRGKHPTGRTRSRWEQ
jgi:hypothetical protein